jgi:hypothetical protein
MRIRTSSGSGSVRQPIRVADPCHYGRHRRPRGDDYPLPGRKRRGSSPTSNRLYTLVGRRLAGYLASLEGRAEFEIRLNQLYELVFQFRAGEGW